MQDKDTTNANEFTDVFRAPETGRLLALDLGTKRIGVAVSDELQITTRPVSVIERKSWKKVLKEIIRFLEEFDAVALVLGLPYNFDGGESEMSSEARRLARNFSLSLKIPVLLHDERLSSYTATGFLRKSGIKETEIRGKVDSTAAAVILSDFIETRNELIKRKTRNENKN